MPESVNPIDNSEVVQLRNRVAEMKADIAEITKRGGGFSNESKAKNEADLAMYRERLAGYEARLTQLTNP